MAFDYKKEFKEFYLPPKKPMLVDVPPMRYLAVRGSGDPNEPEGAYQQALGLLYAVAFTIKMSERGGHRIEGYFPYVVPPLEGLWWTDEGPLDLTHKERLRWISMIRLPDFVSEADFAWAVAEASAKKGRDFSRVELLPYDEGRCVQCMHIGPYDREPETLAAMDAFCAAQGYTADLSAARRHHEIYLSDPRRAAPEKLRTVLRCPVKPGGT